MHTETIKTRTLTEVVAFNFLRPGKSTRLRDVPIEKGMRK